METRIGIDEAGYGPTLGPLLLCSTRFAAPPGASDLWSLLEPVVRKKRKGQRGSVWVHDSKVVHAAKDGLEQLEVAALSFASLDAAPPAKLGELWARLGVDPQAIAGLPWYEGLAERPLPAYGWAKDIAEKAERLARALEKAGVAFQGARARIVDARAFNAAVEQTDNKATAHFAQVATLLTHGVEASNPEAPLSILCDKLGGRDRYGPMLGQLFPHKKIDILAQGKERSQYRIVTREGRAFTVAFMQKADRKSLPVALSSMYCKYLRELYMEALNAHFAGLKPGIKRTAGYPEDAKRFLGELGELLESLPVSKSWLIRSR